MSALSGLLRAIAAAAAAALALIYSG